VLVNSGGGKPQCVVEVVLGELGDSSKTSAVVIPSAIMANTVVTGIESAYRHAPPMIRGRSDSFESHAPMLRATEAVTPARRTVLNRHHKHRRPHKACMMSVVGRSHGLGGTGRPSVFDGFRPRPAVPAVTTFRRST